MKFNKQTLEELKENRLEIIAMSIAMVCAIIGMIILFNPKNLEEGLGIKKFEEGVALIAERWMELEESYNNLSAKFDSLVILNEDSLKYRYFNDIEYCNLKMKVQELNESVEKLEEIIIENPEKALSIPLLKQQFEYQKDYNEKENNQLRNEIARVYDINKWIIGLTFGMLASIITLGVSNISKKKKE